MFAVGLSQGPPHHYWYVWLDKLIPRKDLRAVLLKILLDQVSRERREGRAVGVGVVTGVGRSSRVRKVFSLHPYHRFVEDQFSGVTGNSG